MPNLPGRRAVIAVIRTASTSKRLAVAPSGGGGRGFAAGRPLSTNQRRCCRSRPGRCMTTKTSGFLLKMIISGGRGGRQWPRPIVPSVKISAELVPGGASVVGSLAAGGWVAVAAGERSWRGRRRYPVRSLRPTLHCRRFIDW